MRQVAPIVIALSLILSSAAVAQDQEPLDTGTTEEVRVNLVYVETLVTDGKGNTVADLTQDDFVLRVAGKERKIDVFDKICEVGSQPEPKVNDGKTYRQEIPTGETQRRIVFLFDYYNMGTPVRDAVLGFAEYMVQQGQAANEEVMVAALANGLRIEQRFTRDTNQVIRTMQRMEYDATLYAREFRGVTQHALFNDLSTLMDVLSEYDGPKAVVMFSAWNAPADRNDLWYSKVAEHAASARASIYTVDARGLILQEDRGVAGDDFGAPREFARASPGANQNTGQNIATSEILRNDSLSPAGVQLGSPSLARLANQSGGRLTWNTNDLSLGYARAQRDMTCRYAIGFYTEPGELHRASKISVRAIDEKNKIRTPEMAKVFDEKEKMENRLRAAVVDPGNFENPYVRGIVFPLQPASSKRWDTMMALHFRMKVSPGGDDLDVVATVAHGLLPVGKFQEKFRITPSDDGSPQPVTIYGDAALKPGPHKLTIVVNKRGVDIPQTTTVDFNVPEVPKDIVFVRGPVLGRTVSDGVLIRATQAGEAAEKTRAKLKAQIGETGSFAPLLIHHVDTEDTVLALWDVATLDKKIAAKGGIIERTVVNDANEVVKTLDPIPLELVMANKVRSQRNLDILNAGDLGPGEYRLQVSVKDDKGEELTRSFAPILITEPEQKRAAN